MKKNITIIFSIIATLIGAGFASGQEINLFFYSYGVKGILGLIVSSIFMSFIIFLILRIKKKYNIKNYKELIQLMCRNNYLYNKNILVFIINTVVNILLLISFFIMIAGFGAYFSQEIKINNYIGSGLLAILSFTTFIAGSNKIIKFNNILIPILIFFIVVIGVFNICTIDAYDTISKLQQSNKGGWFISSILYASYNCFFLIPVIINIENYNNTLKDNFIIALFSGLIIFILSSTIFLLLTRINININKLEMPVVYVVKNYFEYFNIIYSFIILTSIYTSAISIGTSVIDNFTVNKKFFLRNAAIICIAGFFVSGFGFTNLVSYIYPIFGYLGIIQIAIIFIKSISKKIA